MTHAERLAYDRAYAKRWPEFKLFHAAKARCSNPKDRAWKNYGGRGIRMCRQWAAKGGFRAFLVHVGRRPSKKLTLDRIDNDRGYEPGNVRWATRSQQQYNRRFRRMTFDGVTLSTLEWAKKIGLSGAQLDWRLRHGWSERDALTIPRYGRRS